MLDLVRHGYRRGSNAVDVEPASRPSICNFGGGGNQTSTQVQQIDPRAWDFISRNAGRAESIANQPFQPYQGEGYAGLSPNQNLAMGAARDLNGAGAPALNYAVQGAQGLLGYTPQNITAAQATNPNAAAGVAQWQNPFENQVVTNTLNDIERSRKMAIMDNTDRAIAAKAFGGSRHGVADSLTNETYGRLANDAASGLRMQGFNTAAGLAQQDATRGLNANQFNASALNAVAGQNQSADLQGANLRSGVSGLLGQLGNSQFNNAQGYVSGLLGTGGVDQQTRQGANQFDYNEFLRRMGYPAQGQTLLNQSLGLLPSGGTTTTTAPKPDQTAAWLGGAGTLLGGAGLLFNGK